MAYSQAETGSRSSVLGIQYQLLIAAYVVAVILFNDHPTLTVVPKLIAPLVGFAFLVLLLGYGPKIHVPMAYRIWAIWFFVAIISTLLADELRLARLITLIQLAGIGLIITNLLIWNRDTRFYRIALLAGAALSSLWIAADPGSFRVAGRLSGTIGNANAHGMLLSVVVVIAVTTALSARQLVVRASVWAIAVWFFALMLQTGSRKAMLGGVVVGGGTVLLIYLYQRWRFRDGSFGPSLAASLLIVPAVLTAVIASDFWHRVERALEPGEGELTADNSLNIRIWLIRRAIDLWSEKPILGHGLRAFARAPEADHFFAMPIGLAAHSNYIDILVSTGLLGLLLYLSIYALLGAKLFALRGLLSYPRYFERYATVTAILALIVVYDVAAISYYSKLLWLVLPWVIAEIQLLETDRRKFRVENMGVTNPGLRPK